MVMAVFFHVSRPLALDGTFSAGTAGAAAGPPSYCATIRPKGDLCVEQLLPNSVAQGSSETCGLSSSRTRRVNAPRTRRSLTSPALRVFNTFPEATRVLTDGSGSGPQLGLIRRHMLESGQGSA